MFVERSKRAPVPLQSEPASKFTAHRAVVPAIAWLLFYHIYQSRECKPSPLDPHRYGGTPFITHTSIFSSGNITLIMRLTSYPNLNEFTSLEKPSFFTARY